MNAMLIYCICNLLLSYITYGNLIVICNFAGHSLLGHHCSSFLHCCACYFFPLKHVKFVGCNFPCLSQIRLYWHIVESEKNAGNSNKSLRMLYGVCTGSTVGLDQICWHLNRSKLTRLKWSLITGTWSVLAILNTGLTLQNRL